jgi:DUF1365 family protein
MDTAGEQLEAVVAEVTNTPWGERHSYVLAARAGDPRMSLGADPGGPSANASSRVLAGSFAKALHVSPYMGMDHRYEWRMTPPAQTLSVHIESRRAGVLAFDATLALRRRPLSASALARVSARYPLNTMRTLALIYAQAALLKLKGVPVHPHPGAGVA